MVYWYKIKTSLQDLYFYQNLTYSKSFIALSYSLYIGNINGLIHKACVPMSLVSNECLDVRKILLATELHIFFSSEKYLLQVNIHFKFSIKSFFSKCNQIRTFTKGILNRKLNLWSDKKSDMNNQMRKI